MGVLAPLFGVGEMTVAQVRFRPWRVLREALSMSRDDWWIDKYFATHTTDGVDGVGHVISLSSFAVLALAATVTLLRETGTSKRDVLMWIYLPAMCMPLALLIILSCLKIRDEHGRRYYHNWQTRFSSMLAVTGLGVAVFWVVHHGHAGTLPGQPVPEAIRLKPAAIDNYTFGDKKPGVRGIRVLFPLEKSRYEEVGNLPERASLTFSLSPALAERWHLWHAYLIETSDRRKPVRIGPVMNYPEPSISTDVFNTSFRQPMDHGNSYSIELILRSERDLSPEQVQNDMKQLMDEEGVRALDKSAL